MADTFLITGTCGTTWHCLAKLLAPAAIDHSKPGTLPVGSGLFFLPQPTVAISQLLVSHRDLQVAAFCEPPAAFLASKAAEPGEISFEASLQAWCESAKSLLALWRKHRNRVHLLDWNECCAYPEEFRNWLQKTTDSPCEWALNPQQLGGGHLETLRQVLCQQAVKEDRLALRLWQEIQAACQPLSSVFQSEPPLSGALLAALQSLDKVQAEHAWLHDERDDLTTRHQSLASEREALLADLQKQKEQALQTHEMLLTEVQKAFKESEGFFAELEATRTEVESLKADLESSRSEAQAAHSTLFAESEELSARLASTVVERDDLASEKSALDSRLSTLTSEREALSADLQTQKEQALQTHEMLLTEIHSAHIESEGFFEEWKTLEAATDFHHLQVGAVSRGEAKSSPTHSHLDFSFERLELFTRRWPRLAVRLVEHNGHAGLAIFDSPADKDRPLYHWKPTGEEGGTGYMLFVPTDTPVLESLVALPATDLVLIRCLTARILGHISVHGESPAGRWSAVARRLLEQIEEIPERLHYDSINATPDPGHAGKSIEFAATHLFFRGSLAERFRWTWKPGTHGGEILIQKNEAFPSLLLGWPLEEDVLRLGEETPEARDHTLSVWNRLLERDRSFLRLLVGTLPDCIHHLCEQHPEQSKTKDDVTAQAHTFRKKLDETTVPRPTRRRSLMARMFTS